MGKINYYTQKEDVIEKYMEYKLEELLEMLENPQDIEAGFEKHLQGIEMCQEEEIKLIKEAIRRKELKEEHLREL